MAPCAFKGKPTVRALSRFSHPVSLKGDWDRSQVNMYQASLLCCHFLIPRKFWRVRLKKYPECLLEFDAVEPGEVRESYLILVLSPGSMTRLKRSVDGAKPPSAGRENLLSLSISNYLL
jgi:hypothetical protein